MTLSLLDSTRKWDYLLLAALCAVPSIIAYVIGTAETVTVDGLTYVGWFDKVNFWPFVIVQPLGLWTLRTAFKRVAHITPEVMPDDPPPLVQLFRDTDSPQRVYSLMRDWLSSVKVMGGALLVSVFIQVADLWELVNVYLGGQSARVSELDWSVMYQAGIVDQTTNAIFCGFAYLTQFTITTLGIWGMAFLTAHNLFFLDRIYQRSQVGPEAMGDYITLDLEDVNRCFGFRVANDGFNTQVIALCIAGVVILMSRFANVSAVGGLITLDQLMGGDFGAGLNFFPDIGQVLLAIGWAVALCIIALPALVKLKPRIPGLGGLSGLSIDGYLREFLTDDQWPYGDRPTERQIDLMAARFARNGFWPTGDNRASHLFFFSFWVFLIILYPIKSVDVLVLLPSLLVLGAIAYGLRAVLLTVLNGSLSYVDERLTTPRPDLLRDEGEDRIRIPGKVFISYRREDTLAWTRLIRQSLVQYMAEERMFMDIETIQDGDDFVDAIESAISECDSLIVVIGPRWSSCVDEAGLRRLEKPDDFVRLEIAAAFSQNKRVIPVLVGGASMPSADELPPDIESLWRRQARELSDSRWEYDVGELAKVLAGRGAT